MGWFPASVLVCAGYAGLRQDARRDGPSSSMPVVRSTDTGADGADMRRLAPRPLSAALDGVVKDVAPATLLARVQAVWSEVAGPRLAAAAAPVSERDGVVTVACESGVWAQELELLAPDLLGGLEKVLGGPLVTKLRFVVGSGVNRS
jgi:predicted nucleic acid-binding Zn ribbon protein